MTRIISILFLSLFFFCACSEDYMESDSPKTAYSGSFRLYTAGYEGDDAGERTTRSAGAGVTFDRLEHYILDSNGDFAANVRSLYDADLSQVRAEGLRDGRYELLILAVKGDAGADGAVIHDLTDDASTWLTFPQEGETLKAEYYYARHPFEVFDGKITAAEVKLTRVVGRLGFELDYANDYVRGSVTSVEVVLSENSLSAASLNADGSVSGERKTKRFSLLEERQRLFFPAVEGSELSGKVMLRFRRHTGEYVERSFDFALTVMPNRHSPVVIRVTHPDDRTGLLYITRKHYTPDNASTILSDTEKKEVFYDRNQRSFRIHEPLQVSMVEDQLQLRFYSAVPIEGVKIYTRLPGMTESVELAYVDSVPAFSNARFEPEMLKKGGVFLTESGRYVHVPAQNLSELGGLKYTIVSDDPYWQKIMRIRARWDISFHSYGGDPDADNGAPAGNWMGMRPVHIREAVVLMTNIAYMCTLDTYDAQLKALQGIVVGNDGQTPVDMATVIPRLESHSSFNMGLVYVGNGVAGLGGGATLGVFQPTYINHYASSYALSIIFHELGHCMGYSHSSGMTYGEFAGKSGDFYVANLSQFPVSERSVLNSLSNPYVYL